MGGVATVVGSTERGVVNVAVAPMVMAPTDGWVGVVFPGASPDPASVLACPEPPSSSITVKTPAPITAAAAHAAPTNFTPRRPVDAGFVFMFG
jgi:hypothetical protein